MIIPKEELVKYLENDVKDLEGKISHDITERLNDFASSEKVDIPVIDYIFLAHQGGRSMRYSARDIGIGTNTLKSIFDTYKLPKLTRNEAIKRLWKGDDFRERQAEAASKRLSKAWEDTDFSEKSAKASKERMRQK